MHKSNVILVLFAIIVASVNAHCSCQTKPPIDVIYRGEACECGRKYPIQLEEPKITEHRDAHYDYGFTIERPQQKPAEVKYSFDFHMEKPRPSPKASLATYAFEVQTPVQKETEVPKRYSFDYQLQTPVIKRDPSNLQELLGHIDRVVVEKQDCPDKNMYGCQCNRYKPRIDLLQRCPKHGHLYQYGGSLNPSYQQRYAQDSSSLLPQISDQVSTPSDRSKRDVANTFPFTIQEILPGLRPNNQIMKVPSVEDENQNRISEILKTNFGEDPRDNIEELLRPKPLGSALKIQSEVEKAQDIELPSEIKLKTPDFISKIKPKLEEARSNLRSKITKIVNKARLEAIKANHLIQKRSTESDESGLSDVYIADENFDGSYEPIWITEDNVARKFNKENLINDPVNANEQSLSNNDRYRKHCDRCGELAKKFPCPSCGAIPSERSKPDYFVMEQENPIPHIPSHAKQNLEYNSPQPRYTFDRFGRRYTEGNGNLKMIGSQQNRDDVTVGSYHNQPAFGELQDILDRNSESIYLTNRKVGEGHLVQPMNFEHASDTIRFIQELTRRNNNQYNEDYYSSGNSYDVGAHSQNYPAKRSFKIVPLVEKEDGSVFVKISPTRSSTKLNKNERTSNGKGKLLSNDNIDDTKLTSNLEESLFNDQKPKANFQKFVRDGKKYEILALSANGSEEGSVGSDEDLEILKYIYTVNQKENSKQNSLSKTTDSNNSKDDNTKTQAPVET